jgi:hypothetical protein
MQTKQAAEEMLDSVSKALGHPTTMVNFIKGYKKTEYLKAIKEYLDEQGDTFDPSDFPSPLPIKVTQKDLDAV